LYLDINDDSLVVTGKQTAVDKFKAESNQGLSGFFYTNVSDNGLVTLSATGKEGEMTKEQQAILAGMSQATSFDVGVVKIGLVESSHQVMIGSYSLGQIDVDDVSVLGSDGPATSAGALIHEVSEQFYKQTLGLSDTKPEFLAAHNLAIGHEDSVNGSTRGEGELPSSHTTSPRNSFNVKYHQSISGQVDIQYTRNGQASTVSLHIKYGNVKAVTK
jgi:hypothetical protein